MLLTTDIDNTDIAAGGSAVYSDAGMQRLRNFSIAVFLDVPLEELKQRIHNYEKRAIARRPDQSFAELFHSNYITVCNYSGFD